MDAGCCLYDHILLHYETHVNNNIVLIKNDLRELHALVSVNSAHIADIMSVRQP